MPVPNEVIKLIIERCQTLIEELTDETDIEKIVYRSYIQGMLDTAFCEETSQKACQASNMEK